MDENHTAISPKVPQAMLWASGGMLTATLAMLGWFGQTVIEVDRTQEAVTSRVTILEAGHETLESLIHAKAADRFTGKEAYSRFSIVDIKLESQKSINDIQYKNLWDRVLMLDDDIEKLENICGGKE